MVPTISEVTSALEKYPPVWAYVGVTGVVLLTVFLSLFKGLSVVKVTLEGRRSALSLRRSPRMTMVLGRPFFRSDPISSYRSFGRDSRPMLKIPCSRYSFSADSGRTFYDSSPYNFDASSSSSSSSKLTGTIALSTPSPSATASKDLLLPFYLPLAYT